MPSVDLLDSLKFREALDGLVEAWAQRDEDATAKALDTVFAFAKGKIVPRGTMGTDKPKAASGIESEPKKAGWPKGKPRKAKLSPVGGPELKPGEAKHYLALANQAQRDAPNVPEKMDRFMQSYVVPALKNPRRGPDGMIWINLPDSFEGRPLPSSNKVWSAALSRIGITKEVMEWGAGADGMSLDAAGAVSQRILKL
jgi:hypothetical protein